MPGQPDPAARQRAKDHLAKLLPAVMEDGRIDDGERAELKRIFSQALLTVGDVREVIGGYLRSLQTEVLADGFVTEEEQDKVRAVVRELAIPRALLSKELLAIVDDKPLPRA